MAPPATDDTLLSPKELDNGKGGFAFAHEDMISLMRYVWEGCLLPQTPDSYATTFGFQISDLNKDVSAELDSIIGSYGEIRTTTTEFRDKTWPAVVDLAAQIRDYAGNAGGTLDSSYYKAILDWVKEYCTTKDDSKKAELKANISAVVKDQLASIDKLSTNVKSTKETLKEFDTKTQTQSAALNNHKRKVMDLLGGSEGRIAALRKQIKTNQDDLQKDKNDYDYDMTVMYAQISYAWIPIIGNIPGAITMGVFAGKAAAMMDTIHKLEKTISDEQAELAADIKLDTDIHRMDASLQNLVTMIKGAITAVGKIEGAWEIIGGDLQGIHDLVKNDGKHPLNEVIARLDGNKIVEKWNGVHDYTTKYVNTAFISEVETKDINQYLKELEDAIKKNTPSKHD
ncbi:hypothetical protein MW887_009900 [Aspergillus wentii]|nr:hypothetical protein MW887_009900 [Aspergillus wentii]